MSTAHRLSLRTMAIADLAAEETFRLGQIMKDSVCGPPWYYDPWPLGDLASPPGTNTAVGYLRLCSWAIVLLREEKTGDSNAVGVCAALPLTQDLVSDVHLDIGVETPLVQQHFGPEESPVVEGSDAYHLIIAIQGERGEAGRQLQSHRSQKIDGTSIARAMMDMLLNSAFHRGYQRLWSKTIPTQKKMVHLFEAMGFANVGSHVASHGTTSAARDIFLTKLQPGPKPETKFSEWYD